MNLEDEDGPYTVTRVRLRDVAFALSSTEAKFDISFDEKQNAIIITTGVPYEQSEYDKREIDLKDANIIDSPHKVLVDGVEAKLDAYNIDGETYTSITKLRKALGNKFYVRTIHDTGETLISFEKMIWKNSQKRHLMQKLRKRKLHWFMPVLHGAPGPN